MFKKTKNNLVELIALLLTIPILLPLYMLIINSFKTKVEAAEMNLRLPIKLNIYANFTEMAKTGKILTGYKNSILITALSVFLIILVTSLTSFIIQRRKQKLSGWLYTLFIMGILLPGFIVPTVLLLHKLHIPGFTGLILLYITYNIPMGVFLYTGYFKSIPRDLDESAIMDGCSLIRLFAKIILPLAKPITATFTIITVLGIWNDFATPLYLISGSANQTVTLGMFNFFGPHSSDWNLVFACIVAATLPVVITYFLLQKYIVAGMTAGALKG